jgi:hypothetical protein
MDIWYVLQDGGRFYVMFDESEGPSDIYEYWGHVPDMDLDAARKARDWFKAEIAPHDVTLIWD